MNKITQWLLYPALLLWLAGCVTETVPMEQYIATQQQVNTLSRRINELETEQASLKTNLTELKQAPRLPTGVSAVPTVRRETGEAPIDAEVDLFQEALARYKAGDAQGAIGQFEQLLNSGVTGEQATMTQYWLGDAYYNQRNYDLASRYFGAYLKAAPQGNHAPNAVNKLVQALKALGREEDATILATQGIGALQ